MSEVHKAISEHSKRQNELVTAFARLDAERERLIEEALLLCKEGRAFSADQINKVTNEINQLAKKGIIPQRKPVTNEMIQEYAGRMKA